MKPAPLLPQSPTDPAELWQLQRMSVALNAGTLAAASLFAWLLSWKEPSPQNVRWFLRHADAIRADQPLGLMPFLHKAMNNTSLILLFEIADQRFVFPGDAQLENWSYALSQPNVLGLLHGIRLYRIGPHGSRNATLKTMWHEIKANSAPKLTTLASTTHGVHGQPKKHTEVPRATLVQGRCPEVR